MLKEYWQYVINKNWSRELYPEMLDTNIFCYGKKNSGKTEQVVIPVLRNAIDEMRSCIVYAPSLKEYAEEIAFAKERGFFILEWNEKEEYSTTGAAGMLFNTPTLLLFSNEHFFKPCQATILDRLLYEISAAPKDDILPDIHKRILVVLEDLCGNMVLPSGLMADRQLQFCITMPSDIASSWWREKTVNNFLESYQFPKEAELTMRFGNPDRVFQNFFSPIQTVLCTGVDGIRPSDHRVFLGHCIFDKPEMKLGGRFAIEEYPSFYRKGVAKAQTPMGREIEITNNIEETGYGPLAKEYITSGSWIVEVSGEIELFHNGNAYIPVVHNHKYAGCSWIKSRIASIPNLKLLRTEECESITRFVCWIKSLDMEIDFTITHIAPEDVEVYQISYLLQVLQKEEYRRWIECGGAEDAGIDCVHDDPEEIYRKIQAYNASLMEEMDELTTPEPAEELPPPYHWTPPVKEEPEPAPVPVVHYPLPEEGVLFLGGHQNMTKKLKQIFPKWTFITDDYFKNWKKLNHHTIFYFTAHSSHKMMQYVNSRISDNTSILYVTATNIPRLISEMETQYQNLMEEKQKETEVLDPCLPM